MLLLGCQGDEDAARTNTVYPVETRPLDAEGAVIPERASVTLQLASAPHARYAGYYAAEARGFFDDVKLDVTIRAGGDVEAAQVVASGRADFGVDTLPALLMARDDGTDVVSIAQVFARSGSVVEDAAAGMPADGVFAAGEWLAKPENRDLAVRFLQASFLGWVFCRDYPDECVRILHDRVPAQAESRQLSAAERDQRADLAERDRHRHDGSGHVPAHVEHRPATRADRAAGDGGGVARRPGAPRGHRGSG